MCLYCRSRKLLKEQQAALLPTLAALAFRSRTDRSKWLRCERDMCNFPSGCLVRQGNQFFIIFLSFQTSLRNTTTSRAAVWWSLPSVGRGRQPRGDSWPSLNDKQCRILYTASRQISLTVCYWYESFREKLLLDTIVRLFGEQNANFGLCSVR